jgi:N-acetylglutamate synthase-like GNAT family acetyltransferase
LEALLEHVKSRCRKQGISTSFVCEDKSLIKDAVAKNATKVLR